MAFRASYRLAFGTMWGQDGSKLGIHDCINATYYKLTTLNMQRVKDGQSRKTMGVPHQLTERLLARSLGQSDILHMGVPY